MPPKKIGTQKNLGKLQKIIPQPDFSEHFGTCYKKSTAFFTLKTYYAVWLVAMPGQDDVPPDQLEHPPGASLNLQSDDRYHSNLGFRRSPRGG